MTQIVWRDNRHQFEDLLDEMHRRRYRMLVEVLGWNIPGIKPGYDKDAFDTDDTVYLLKRHPETGELVASVRYNPTTKPHLISEVFPHQCEFEGVPAADDIWECSRLVYDTDRMSGETFQYVRKSFACAMTEFCVAAGIRAISWLSKKELYAAVLKMWPTRPLGLPVYYADDDAEYIAAFSEMNEAAIAGRRKWFGSDEPVIFSEIPDLGLKPSSSVPSAA